MKMRYVTRKEGPLAYGTLIGMAGVLHAFSDNVYEGDTAWELFIDTITGDPESGWCVGAIFSPLADGVLTGGHTFIAFGSADRQAFDSFEAAFSFCAAFGKQLYDARVDDAWVNRTVVARALRVFQWLDGPAVPLAGEVTVSVDVPPNRVLH